MKQDALLSVMILAAIFYGCADEGIVKTDDCRTLVFLSPDTIQQYYRSFICNSTKRASGKLVVATCTRITTYGGLFYDSGKCDTAYIFTYASPPDKGCTSTHPYSGYNQKCYTDWSNADQSLFEKRDIY